MTRWKFFVGASILAVGLLVKAGAPLVPVALGLTLAGIVTWKIERRTRQQPR
jgi:hypothetical protein